MTLIVVGLALFTGASASGVAITAVIPGLLLAMIASTTVPEQRPWPRAITILLLVPAAFGIIVIASLLDGFPLVSDVVFVGVAVGAVYLRGLGPRGSAVGTLVFMSYFVALLTRITPPQLLVVAAALGVSAGITIVIRQLTGRRHQSHDLQRILRALGDRARRVAHTLSQGVSAGHIDERLQRSIRSRLAASSATASSVEEVLERATNTIVPGISEAALGARVFDFQLSLERLVDAVARLLSPENKVPTSPDELVRLANDIDAFALAVQGPVKLDRAGYGQVSHPDPGLQTLEGAGDVVRLERTLALGTEAWHRVASRGPDPRDADGLSSDGPQDGFGSNDVAHTDVASDKATNTTEPTHLPIHALSRQAAQVGVAAALSIVIGNAISSSYWVWAVIAAFVIYIGTSSRGEILTRGWLRIVGTGGGVIFGVLLATVVGENTTLAIILIGLSIFFSVYFTPLSSAFTIFFITIMLALLYGLMGVFSVELLWTRLSETAVGAAIGVGAAFVVFPTRTRDLTRDRLRNFLGSLAAAVTAANHRIDAEPALPDKRTHVGATPGSINVLPTSGRDLRNAFDELESAVKPLVEGVAGISDLSGSRRTMQLIRACERHGRALLRAADSSPGNIENTVGGNLLRQACDKVRVNVELMSGSVGGGYRDLTMTSAEQVLDLLDDHIPQEKLTDQTILIRTSRNLRAIDRAICARAGELGAAIRIGSSE